MSLPVEQRVNMSLDDVIKAKNQDKKAAQKAQKKPAAAAPAAPKVKNGNANAAKNSKSNKQRKNSKGTLSASSSTTQLLKTAKIVGASKAKRNAAVDKKRGLRETATPTKKEVKNATAQAVQSSGLKITFSAKDLQKTTEKVVSQQIRAVLSRQTTAKKNETPTANRAIIAPRKGAAGAGARKSPKVRGQVITVKR